MVCGALAHSVRFDIRFFISVRPVQLSGGLKQRVAIARAFAGDPRVVVCDEPTSAPTRPVQAAILNLLAELQTDKKVAYLFISHDLGVVRYLSDRIAVLYLGRPTGFGPAERVFRPPHHPLHGGAALLDPGRRGRAAGADPAGGRDPVGREPADGLRLPYPLPAQVGRHLRAGGAAAQGVRAGPLHALPYPARGAGGEAGRDRRRLAGATASPTGERGADEAGDSRRPRGGPRGVGRPLRVEESDRGPGTWRGAGPAACQRRLATWTTTPWTARPRRAARGARARGRWRRRGGGRWRETGRARVMLSWLLACGHCAECLRELPHLCANAWRDMGHGGSLDGTPRLSRDGEPAPTTTRSCRRSPSGPWCPLRAASRSPTASCSRSRRWPGAVVTDRRRLAHGRRAPRRARRGAGLRWRRHECASRRDRRRRAPRSRGRRVG